MCWHALIFKPAQQLADAMDTYNRSTGSTAAGVAIVVRLSFLLDAQGNWGLSTYITFQDISDAIVSNSINSIKQVLCGQRDLSIQLCDTHIVWGQVIDISTDGVTNSGIDPSTAADQAVAKGASSVCW